MPVTFPNFKTPIFFFIFNFSNVHGALGTATAGPVGTPAGTVALETIIAVLEIIAAAPEFGACKYPSSTIGSKLEKDVGGPDVPVSNRMVAGNAAGTIGGTGGADGDAVDVRIPESRLTFDSLGCRTKNRDGQEER